MPKLYLKEYARALAGREVFIACREGILRDHFQDIITDIKFLVRHGARTALLHNMPNRFANQKLVVQLERRLPATGIVRISPEIDFYEAVLDHRESMFKVIFLERRYLIDRQANKINAITTARVRESMEDFGDLIANVNFKGAMACICRKIEAGQCDRVHILAAGKNSIKHELFTVEGAGTLIANNFQEDFRQVRTDEEVALVHRILEMYKRSGFLKPRTKSYLNKNRQRFYVTAIDGIVVGCVEQKIIDARTVEMGALAISTRFRNQRVGVHTVKSFMALMKSQGYTRFISLTNNPRLEALYTQLGFIQESRPEYRQRQEQSPDVKMFCKIDDPVG
ncbi:GNAT family N-acetyltransferase [uncultured Desulfosarcina sp.]|uniref:GNAT family N-acetyltransferase n=1 Tax=uncultured Desulfosarcina sp. TaxID=218289 RepID=UPI0029C9A223|nr:GNAT family N-acetyltransferase [uncultured Desulfosarcina sp.]